MRKLNIIFFILLFGGCSPKTFITSIQPEIHEIPKKSSILFEQGKEAAWNNILTLFANSEFSIDRINMDLYIVKLRLTGQPDLYIDCGKKMIDTEGSVVTIINTKKNYSYRAYKSNHIETYSVSNNLTGYANLSVTGNEVSSQVVIQFDFELETEVDRMSTRGIGSSARQQQKLQLDSNKQKKSDLLKTTCRSTGNLERQVFEIISKMQGLSSSLRMND